MGTGKFASNNSSVKRKFSPRPGEANCKLPSRNDIILNSNMTTDNNLVSNTINEISEKNERILQTLRTCKNKSERILLNHELRLNTVELTVDCLDNIKYGENGIYNISAQEKKIETLEKTVTELGKKLILLTQMIQAKNNNDQITMEINNIVEKKVEKTIEKTIEKTVDNMTEETNNGPTFE